MRQFLLAQNKTLLGKFSPRSLLLNFLARQAVIIGTDVGSERSSPLFRCFFQKQFVQDCGLGVKLALACLLLQVGQTLRGESKRAPSLNTRVSIRHNTLYHITGMIIVRFR